MLQKTPERGLTGAHIKRAHFTRLHISNEPQVGFEFDSEGAKIFGDITTEYQPKDTPNGKKFYQLAIVLDGELRSAPRINGPITGGSGVIEGRFDAKEVQELVAVFE